MPEPTTLPGTAEVTLDGGRSIVVQHDLGALRVYLALTHRRARTVPLPSLDPAEARALAAALVVAASEIDRAAEAMAGSGGGD